MNNQTDEYEREREKLRMIKGIFETAVETNNIEAVRPFTHPDFSFVSFTDKSFDNFDSFKQQWAATRESMVGKGSFTTRLNPDPTIFINDVAVASGQAENTLINSKGERYDFTNHWSVIFKREAEDWKVLRAHNSLDPFGNPMLIKGVKQKIIKFSILSFLGGAILCSLLSYLL